MTRTAIAIPCLDLCPIPFALSLAALMDYNARLDLDVALIHQSGSIIMDARNALVTRAQDMDATHILFLDSDLTFPPDTLTRLHAHHLPVVAATYVKRTGEHELLGKHATGDVTHLIPHSDLHPYLSIPLGCALIDLRVFTKLHKPYFRYITREAGTISEDTYFSIQCREYEVPIYVDPTLTAEVGHVGQEIFRP